MFLSDFAATSSQQHVTLDVMYQTRGRVFHWDIQIPRSGLKNEAGAAEFFSTHFKVLGYPTKHSASCLIKLLKLIKYGENEGIKWPKSM